MRRQVERVLAGLRVTRTAEGSSTKPSGSALSRSFVSNAKKLIGVGIAVLLLSQVVAQITTIPTGYFVITSLTLSAGNNLHFRVFGFPGTISQCNNANWGYINEDDSGAQAKISALMLAYSLKKQVNLSLQPVDYGTTGIQYCRIADFTIKD